MPPCLLTKTHTHLVEDGEVVTGHSTPFHGVWNLEYGIREELGLVYGTPLSYTLLNGDTASLGWLGRFWRSGRDIRHGVRLCMRIFLFFLGSIGSV